MFIYRWFDFSTEKIESIVKKYEKYVGYKIKM